MSTFRSTADATLSQKDEGFSNFGCHLCLYVCGQNGTSVTCRPDQILTENGNKAQNTNIVGYIQMDETQYVQWLPSKLRQTWA